jgi:hypothetical protein
MQNTTLIIAGMHRSGTSLISNWLNRCGLPLGETLMGSAPSNQEGHFEDMEFIKLHEEILVDNHLPHTGLIEDPHIDISMYHMEKLKSVISLKNKLHEQWGWKDPRTCLFLDTYKQLLPDAKYLVIIREYHSVVSSLLQRDFSDMEEKYLKRKFFGRMIWKYFRRERRLRSFFGEQSGHYLKVWIAYNEELLKLIETLPQEAYLVLNYNMLKENSDSIFNYLKDQWHIALNPISFADVFKQKLINKPVDTDSFIVDKALISKAEDLQNELNKHLSVI